MKNNKKDDELLIKPYWYKVEIEVYKDGKVRSRCSGNDIPLESIASVLSSLVSQYNQQIGAARLMVQMQKEATKQKIKIPAINIDLGSLKQ